MRSRLQKWALYTIANWPRWFAEKLFAWADKQNHVEVAVCPPCIAQARRVRDGHCVTTSPSRTLYCSKCGLDLADAPLHCANKVKKVNNPKKKKGFVRVLNLFWD